ncbi:MAG: RdgB/HAM1 family non-canonical purine NTP pyrophosphatase [Promethearchaeota archaeon]|jgi:XTP/dITP diphosphohydrolase
MLTHANTVYFVTGNIHKYWEVSEHFNNEVPSYHVEQRDIKTTEIQAQTLLDVASFKIKSIKENLDTSFFVEDAGFFVDSPLGGFPGVYSSYVLRTIGNEGILRLIPDFKSSEAHFSSVIALYFKPRKEFFFFEGKVEGRVSETIRGKGGFGFDPIFIPNSIPDKTFAEISTAQKNKISHRGQAIRKLTQFLKKNAKLG